jgi:RNA polymerase sigma factor (TIGR02999 family)
MVESGPGGSPNQRSPSLLARITGKRAQNTSNFRGWKVENRTSADITGILCAISSGDPEAPNRLLPLVYQQLRRLAHRKLGHESPGQTLQTTDLVHEVYLRLLGDRPPRWENRAHFFAAAAVAMRRILVDRARRRRMVKHGGGLTRVSLDGVAAGSRAQDVDLLALDEAMTRLESHDAAFSQVVMLRFFAGLDIQETAKALGVSPATVKRRWDFAKAWLHQQLSAPR